MKKRILAVLLVLALCLSGLPAGAAAAAPTAQQVYASMIALKSSYPEGMPWTNDNYYEWKGGMFIAGGYGCAGFAFLLSDAAFGDLPGRQLNSFAYSDVRVGDILRVNNDTHSVIVLEVHDNNVIIAEGNYNSSIHWGRSMSRQEVLAATYLITRYPGQQQLIPSSAELSITNGVVTKYTGQGGAVTIPEGIIGIGEKAFSECGTLTSVSMPASVAFIMPNAFASCTGLTGVTIPDGVTSISWGAFAGCTSLASVTLPGSVTGIESFSFNRCEALTGVTIPNGVTKIGFASFGFCRSLASVTIPGSVTEIDDLAFAYCTALKDVYYGGTQAQWEKIRIGSDNEFLLSAAIHCSGPAAQQPGQPQGVLTAIPTNDAMTVDNRPVTPAAYKIDGANYFKLRDVAALLSGTAKQFNVGYDGQTNSAAITTGQGYDKLPTDLQGRPAAAGTAAVSNDSVLINGVKSNLTVYKINNANYLKIRDLAAALDFDVAYIDGRMVIDTSKPHYDPNT